MEDDQMVFSKVSDSKETLIYPNVHRIVKTVTIMEVLLGILTGQLPWALVQEWGN